MSSLIYSLQEDHALIATDTLAVHTDGTFSHQTNKVATVPHLNLAICGLGIAGLSDQVYMFANSAGVADIHELSERLPEFLRGFWAHLNDKFGPVPDHVTSTIYLFGFGKSDGRLYGYAHELTSNFEARELRVPSRGAKPTEGITLDDLDLGHPEDFIALMKKQKAAQDARPPESRLYIGGSIQFTLVSHGTITVTVAGTLDD